MDKCVLRQDRYQQCWPRRKHRPEEALLRPVVPKCISRARAHRRCMGQGVAEFIESIT